MVADISLNKARTIIRKICARERETDLPLCVAVLDHGGHVQASEREAGTLPERFVIAHSKAYGAVMPGQAQMACAEGQACVMAAVDGVFGAQVLPTPGGVLLRGQKGEMIGAVGVTGDRCDNHALGALAGIEAAGYQGEV